MQIILMSFLFLSLDVMADAKIVKALKHEWKQMRELVATVAADGDVGGYMMYKEYGEITLLWRTTEGGEENEVIRLFLVRDSGQPFAVTYHKSDVIRPGRIVLRRFIGTEPTGWINHTIDFQTGDYLGSQGSAPELTRAELKLIKDWGITLF